MASISQKVDDREQHTAEGSGFRQEGLRTLGILLGVLIYALGVNLFLRPLRLYSGGLMGYAQVLQTVLHDRVGLSLGGVDLSGIIYYILNLPGLVMAYRTMRHRFVVKTVFTVTCVTVVLTLIPIPRAPILDDRLANCLVAGIVSGIGSGLILRMGACDGGMNLVGMLLLQTRGNISVGQVSIGSNILLYLMCLLLFDVPTTIYSLIYSVIASLVTDRVHVQNINVQVMIITKVPDVEPLEVEIMGQMHRGLTRWDVVGGYTGEKGVILMTVVSKYELHQLRHIIHQFDPHAFVMQDEGISVDGHFLRKLT